MFYSQFKQDEYIYNRFFKDKEIYNPFFLEIGADDGIKFSNCAFFEKELGWQGIAIEPREVAFKELKNNRNCICLNTVLASEEKECEFMELFGYGLGLSGIIENYDKRHLDRINRELQNPENKGKRINKVKTQTLDKILDEYKIDKIDFLSIDTEGSELDILSSIDFKKISINVITIEDNYHSKELLQFFKSRGYKLDRILHCDKIFYKT